MKPKASPKKALLIIMIASSSLHAMQEILTPLTSSNVIMRGAGATATEPLLFHFPGNIPTTQEQKNAHSAYITQHAQASEKLMAAQSNFILKSLCLYGVYYMDQQIVPHLLKTGQLCCIPGDFICRLLYPGHEKYQFRPCSPNPD